MLNGNSRFYVIVLLFVCYSTSCEQKIQVITHSGATWPVWRETERSMFAIPDAYEKWNWYDVLNLIIRRLNKQYHYIWAVVVSQTILRTSGQEIYFFHKLISWLGKGLELLPVLNSTFRFFSTLSGRLLLHLRLDLVLSVALLGVSFPRFCFCNLSWGCS